MVRLFCLWVFSQCFEYKALPWLRWNLGIVVSPDRIMLCIVLLAYATRVAGRGSKSGGTAGTTLGRFLFLFALVGALSFLVSAPDANSTTFGHLTRLTNIAFFPVISYVAARRLDYTREMLKEVVSFFAALGAYLAFTGVCEHYAALHSLVFPKYILDRSVGIQFGRTRGPLVDAVGDGGMLLIGFLALSFVASFLKGFKRVLGVVLTLLVVPAIYCTNTRAVWLGLGAISGTLLSLRTSIRRTATLVWFAILIGFVAGIGSKFSVSESTLFSRRQNTVDYRIDNYATAWTAFRRNPLFGIGFGKFQAEWAKYFDKRGSLTRGLDDGNASTPLGILAEQGLVGFTPFLGIIVCSVLVCFAAYRRLGHEGSEFERSFAVLGLGAIEAFVVLGMTNDMHSQPSVNVSVFWLIGIVSTMGAASSGLQVRHTAEEPKARLRLGGVGFQPNLALDKRESVDLSKRSGRTRHRHSWSPD
jgi:hypothetical protein